jgi:adenine deaminase
MARLQATPRAIAVARGDEAADLLITGGRVFAPATREWIDTPLAVADGVVAGWGERDSHQVVDVAGSALTRLTDGGLVDVARFAYVPVEASKRGAGTA